MIKIILKRSFSKDVIIKYQKCIFINNNFKDTVFSRTSVIFVFNKFSAYVWRSENKRQK